jgi:hypothetical protein
MIDKDRAISDLQAAQKVAFANIDKQFLASNYWTGYYHAVSDLLNVLEEGTWEKDS